MFTKVMAATGINDLDVLVKNFIKGEERNFSEFEFINKTNEEIETFEAQILEMQTEIDKSMAESGSKK